MKSTRNAIAIASLCLFAGWLLGAPQAPAGGAAQTKGTPKTAKTAVKTPPKPAAQSNSAKAPLTKDDVLKRWNDGDQTLFLNELKLRGLAFEPEEDWVASLKNPDA